MSTPASICAATNCTSPSADAGTSSGLPAVEGGKCLTQATENVVVIRLKLPLMKEAASEEGRMGIVRGGRGGIGGRGGALCNDGRKALMTKANRQKRERARRGKAQGVDMKCKKRRGRGAL